MGREPHLDVGVQRPLGPQGHREALEVGHRLHPQVEPHHRVLADHLLDLGEALLRGLAHPKHGEARDLPPVGQRLGGAHLVSGHGRYDGICGVKHA